MCAHASMYVRAIVLPHVYCVISHVQSVIIYYLNIKYSYYDHLIITAIIINVA